MVYIDTSYFKYVFLVLQKTYWLWDKFIGVGYEGMYRPNIL